MSDGYGGLAACQDKGRSIYSEHCKQSKKLLMLMAGLSEQLPWVTVIVFLVVMLLTLFFAYLRLVVF